MYKTFLLDGMNIRKTCLEAEDLFKQWEVTPRDCMDMVLAIDEALTNIKLHGYDNPDKMDSTASIRISIDNGVIIILITDTAPAFNINNVEAPEKSTYLASGAIGGFGVSIINKLMDNVEIQRKKNQNMMQMSKKIDGSGGLT